MLLICMCPEFGGRTDRTEALTSCTARSRPPALRSCCTSRNVTPDDNYVAWYEKDHGSNLRPAVRSHICRFPSASRIISAERRRLGARWAYLSISRTTLLIMSSMVAGGGRSCDSDAVIVAPMIRRVCDMILLYGQLAHSTIVSIRLTIEHPGTSTEDVPHDVL
jgi:hypothetical protein